MNLPKLKADLSRDEGMRLVAYIDSTGHWTVGVGHLLGSSPRMSSISPDECDALLERDIQHATALAADCVPLFSGLDEVRQRALVNMAFNRGGHMKDSTTITPAINAAAASGDWSKVAQVIAASPWAAQVGIRAKRLSDMLANGTDPA